MVTVDSCASKKLLSEFDSESEEYLVIGKQRLAKEQDCSTVDYILRGSAVEV